MSKNIILILCLLASPVLAQTTVTIPAPDGKTIVSNAGIWSCIQSSGGLPSGLSFDGTTFTAPQISTAQITLTGGTTYPAGQYLVNLDASGNETFTPYTAPSGGGSTVIGKTFSVATSTIGASAQQSSTYTVTGIPAPGTPAVVFVNPSIAFTGNLRYEWRVSAANTVVVRITNVQATSLSIPAYTLYISAVH